MHDRYNLKQRVLSGLITNVLSKITQDVRGYVYWSDCRNCEDEIFLFKFVND